MICTRCGENVEIKDQGSDRYQELYNCPLSVICERCLGNILNKVAGRKG